VAGSGEAREDRINARGSGGRCRDRPPRRFGIVMHRRMAHCGQLRSSDEVLDPRRTYESCGIGNARATRISIVDDDDDARVVVVIIASSAFRAGSSRDLLSSERDDGLSR